MRQRFAGITFVNAHLVGSAVMPALQEILILLGAGTKRDEECPALDDGAV